MFPNFTEIPEDVILQELSGGIHKVFVTKINGRRVVYKLINTFSDNQTRGLAKKVLKFFDKPLYEFVTNKISIYKYRDKSANDISEIELKILDEWVKRGIPCTKVLEKTADEIIYEYIASENFSVILDYPGLRVLEFNELIKTYDLIRSEAKKDKDKTLLHSDPHLRNFLFSFYTKKAIAIDPAIKFKANLSFEEADAYSNNFVLHSISDLASENKINYLKMFADYLSKEEKQRILKINLPLDLFSRNYLNFRSKAVSLIRGKELRSSSIYCDEKIRMINEVLS